jgi:mycothiol synthase
MRAFPVRDPGTWWVSGYRVREFAPTDYGSIARIGRRVTPDFANSAEEIRHYWESFAAPGLDHHRLVAEAAGTSDVVAWGAIDQWPFTHEDGWYWVQVVVDPDHRRRGLGAEIYARLEGEAVRRKARGLRVMARAEDPEGLAFFHRHRFVERRRVWRSRLDLSRVDLAAIADRTGALAAEGVRFTTLAEEGPDRDEVRRRYYALHAETSRDVPALGPARPLSFDQFLRFELERPGFRADATFFAVSDGRYVGVTTLDESGATPEEVHVGFTGVSRDFRRRGIALELKRRSIRYARDAGYRTMRTGNDSENRPIWSINERLGFRPVETQVLGEKSVGPAAPRDPGGAAGRR